MGWPRQVRAIADNVLLRLKHSHGVLPSGVEASGGRSMDCARLSRDCCACVPARAAKHDDLDGLWAEAELIPLSDLDVEATAESLLSPGQPLLSKTLILKKQRTGQEKRGVTHVSWSDWDEFDAGDDNDDWLFQPQSSNDEESESSESSDSESHSDNA